MDCYSEDHILLCIFLGLPILLLWVILTPIVALILLIKNFKKQDDNKVKQYFLILYEGLRPEVYYWEFVNSFRKISIMLILTIFTSYSVYYQVLISVILLVITIRVQVLLKPYANQENNDIEVLSVSVGCFTLLSAIIFSYNGHNLEWFNSMLFLSIVVINIIFLSKWSYLFVKSLKQTYATFTRL